VFNKNLWASVSKPIVLENYPALPCPYCNTFSLILDLKSLNTRALSGQALRAYSQKFKNDELRDYIGKEENTFLKLAATVITLVDSSNYNPSQFISFFKCGMCNESVSATGFAKMPKDEISNSKHLKVENFNPPLSLFPLSNTTPNSVNEELLSSFNHFFADTCSAGNRLRRAMEKLCSELGYNQGNLHRRIQSMAKEYPQEARWLESLKLVGNEATHADNVTEDDLLDSYKVFEVVLDIFRRQQIEPEIDNTVLKLESKYKKI
jgi:hypothetical protein